jgi:glycosyltransferase involved in cell wall biosynthesis
VNESSTPRARRVPVRSALVVTDSLVWTAETEYAVAVAEAEASMGASVTLAAPPDGPVAERLPSDVAFHGLPGRRPSSSPADFVADVRDIAALARGGCFDVVHSSRQTAHLMAALSVPRETPLVHLRGGASTPSGHAGNRFLYKRMTARVVVSSARIEGWLVEGLGMPPGRVHRLYSPVGDSWFEPPSGGAGAGGPFAELGIPPDASVVLNVARLSPIKGHTHLVAAMAAVVETVPETFLALVGEPWSGQPEGLSRQAEELGIGGRVVFAGRRENVRELVAAADVCVTSSIGSEENSRAVSEYMAAGRPVVATAVGVISELLADGETGRLVPPGEPGPLADAIVGVLSDRAAAEAMGARARESARERFSARAFVDGLSRVLEAAEVPA